MFVHNPITKCKHNFYDIAVSISNYVSRHTYVCSSISNKLKKTDNKRTYALPH